MRGFFCIFDQSKHKAQIILVPLSLVVLLENGMMGLILRTFRLALLIKVMPKMFSHLRLISVLALLSSEAESFSTVPNASWFMKKTLATLDAIQDGRPNRFIALLGAVGKAESDDIRADHHAMAIKALVGSGLQWVGRPRISALTSGFCNDVRPLAYICCDPDPINQPPSPAGLSYRLRFVGRGRANREGRAWWCCSRGTGYMRA